MARDEELYNEPVNELRDYDQAMRERIEAEKVEREELQAEAEQLEDEVSELGGRLKSTKDRLMNMVPLTDSDSENAIEIGLLSAKKSHGIKIDSSDFANPKNADLVSGDED